MIRAHPDANFDAKPGGGHEALLTTDEQEWVTAIQAATEYAAALGPLGHPYEGICDTPGLLLDDLAGKVQAQGEGGLPARSLGSAPRRIRADCLHGLPRRVREVLGQLRRDWEGAGAGTSATRAGVPVTDVHHQLRMPRVLRVGLALLGEFSTISRPTGKEVAVASVCRVPAPLARPPG